MRLKQLIGSLSRDRRAAALVEFAFAAPVLAGLLIGLVDLSMYISSNLSVERAARAGGEYAVVNGYSATGVAAAVTSATRTRNGYLSAISASPAPTKWCACPNATTGLATATCGTTCSSGLAAGSYVTATATARYTPLFPWPGLSGSRQITSSSTVRIE